MPKFKGKPSRSKSPAGPRGGGSGYSGCDTLLVPRIQEYARSNDIADVDDVVEHLRSCYREYLRKPMLIFRKGVERAIDEVRRRGPPLKPSVSIEDMEAAHLERRGLKMAGEAGDDSEEDSDDESGSDEDSDEDELEGKGLSDDGSDEDASMSAEDAPGAVDDDDARGGRGETLRKRRVMNDANGASGPRAPPIPPARSPPSPRRISSPPPRSARSLRRRKNPPRTPPAAAETQRRHKRGGDGFEPEPDLERSPLRARGVSSHVRRGGWPHRRGRHRARRASSRDGAEQERSRRRREEQQEE